MNVIVPQLFNNPSKESLEVDEGGIIILSRKQNQITVEHSFNRFSDLIRTFNKE